MREREREEEEKDEERMKKLSGKVRVVRTS